ncbi:MAG: YutD family protein [Bacilli bacterium]|nr:YutD family protein [Bacilli bacterium]
MKEIVINDKKYEVVKINGDAIDIELLSTKITDYFDDYDYIVGDWAYGKIRLKGFYESGNKKCNKINDIVNLDDYINNNCAYGCKWFLIKKIND